MPAWMMDQLLDWLVEKVIGLLDGLVTILTASLFSSPNVTVLPQVQSISDKSALVVSACFILAILAAGIAVMAGDSLEMRYSIKELLPRLVVGFTLSVFAMPLTSELITLANALTMSMTGVSAPTSETVRFVRTRLDTAKLNEGSVLLLAVIGVLIVVLMFLLVGGWLARICLLLLLAGVAPLALACYATPWTQSVAGMWWRGLLGCLVTPALQAITFATGVDLLINPDANLPILLNLSGSETFNLLLVIVLLWVTVRIPAAVSRYIGSAGTRTGAVVLRAVVIQGMMRGLPLLRGVS